jgi:luciferase family oxidoreductase group 1
MKNIPISILDLVPVLSGKTPADSFKNSLDLAQQAEKFGYNRFWMSEHHNMKGVASSATSVLIGYIAGGTSSIRVGAGGIMLPNHAPLVIAEQFGTLESLYSNRIDLGIGRAPGTDPLTTRALRRDIKGVDEFPANVIELKNYFASSNGTTHVRAVPGEGLDIPIWLLGSSTYSAQLAGMLGLPFSFASHFAPALLLQALQLYRENFQPSESLKEPYVMAGVNVIAADTDEEAQHLASSLYAFFLNVIRGTSNPLMPPVNMDLVWNESEKYSVQQMLGYCFVGSPQTIQSQLQQFIDKTRVNELMVVSNIFDHSARVHSYKLLSELKFKPE